MAKNPKAMFQSKKQSQTQNVNNTTNNNKSNKIFQVEREDKAADKEKNKSSEPQSQKERGKIFTTNKLAYNLDKNPQKIQINYHQDKNKLSQNNALNFNNCNNFVNNKINNYSNLFNNSYNFIGSETGPQGFIEIHQKLIKRNSDSIKQLCDFILETFKKLQGNESNDKFVQIVHCLYILSQKLNNLEKFLGNNQYNIHQYELNILFDVFKYLQAIRNSFQMSNVLIIIFNTINNFIQKHS